MARVPVVDHFQSIDITRPCWDSSIAQTIPCRTSGTCGPERIVPRNGISQRVGYYFQTPSSPPNIIENTPASVLVCPFTEIEVDNIYLLSLMQAFHYDARDRDRRTSLTSPILSRPQITMYPKSGWRHVRPNRAEPGRSWWLRCQFSP